MATTHRNHPRPPTSTGPRPRMRGASSTDAATITVQIDEADRAADPVEQLRLLKLELQTTREALMRVSPDTLNNADHAAWTQQIFQVSLAINSLRNAALDALTAEFVSELPRLHAATKQLGDELAALQEATAVIQAVGSVLGIIASIPVLLP